MQAAIALFTRDLRIVDNPVLSAAADGAPVVIPLFVLDPDLLGQSSANRRWTLGTALTELRANLQQHGADLIVREGRTATVLAALADRYDIAGVHLGADFSTAAARREESIRDALPGVRVKVHDTHSIVAPGTVTPAGGDHYRVFTPYFKAWEFAPRRPIAQTPWSLRLPSDLERGRLPLPEVLANGPVSRSLQPIGEATGTTLTLRWLATGVRDYAERRDLLFEEGTSRLSAHLHFGTVSARWIDELLSNYPGERAFRRQLCWRDFNGQLLAVRPDLTNVDLRPRGDHWRWDPEAVRAWKAGRTGYPIVDAGMRQLQAEGFLHNRARMITASFLTKHLHVDWRIGAAHFESLLVDADVANNRASWQWVAGTGMDTRPNRVLNPLRQGERFDPDARWVRRWIPELRGIEDPTVAREPWRRAGTLHAPDYPARIVDLGEARSRFLASREA